MKYPHRISGMTSVNKKYGIAFLAGVACVLGFAPFAIYPLSAITLAVLFYWWRNSESATHAAKIGFVFGLGLFCVGIGWLYIAMHDYGDMPSLLALLATFLFAAFWALLPALAGYLQARFKVSNALRLILVMPAVWVLVEWLRGLLFTGLPWLTLGYAYSDSPLAGYAPVLGVYGVSLVVAASAGLLAWLFEVRWSKQGQIALALLVVLCGGGALLRAVAWTQPQGEPFSVALVQGNIAQDLKFTENALVGTLESYRRLVLQSDARLIVLPETALPLQRHELPETLVTQLRDHAKQNGGDVLIGSFVRDDNNHFYNSVFTLGSAEEQLYRKQHLVPFGEFIPLRPVLGWLINEVLNIPMGDLTRGSVQQAPLNVAGQQIAVNICYEDVFGEEIIRALPQATLLVNVTNDAWYGHSYAAEQHNQIAQLRALETGRMMLRATNTGVTSIIGADGKVLQKIPQHQEGVLLGMAQGYAGITPYVRWGNAAVLLLIAMMLVGAWISSTGKLRILFTSR
ncbi:MAG: apolipoprotein N-acyltransferase [Gallionella sp.]